MLYRTTYIYIYNTLYITYSKYIYVNKKNYDSL